MPTRAARSICFTTIPVKPPRIGTIASQHIPHPAECACIASTPYLIRRPIRIFTVLGKSTRRRWSKSYWREMYLQLTWSTLNRSSMFSLLDSLYGLMFPVLLIATLLVDSFYRTWTSLIAIGVMTVLTPVLRSLFVYCFLRRENIVFYSVFYPLIYFSTLPAIKLVALFTLKNNTWGTSSRKQVVKTWAPVIPVFVWWGILVSGFVVLSMGDTISRLRFVVQDHS